MPPRKQGPLALKTRTHALEEAERRLGEVPGSQKPQVEKLIATAKSAALLATSVYDTEIARVTVAKDLARVIDALPTKPLKLPDSTSLLRQELGLPHGAWIAIEGGNAHNPVALHQRLVDLRKELKPILSDLQPVERKSGKGQPVSPQVLFAADLMLRVKQEELPPPTVAVIGLLAVGLGVVPFNSDPTDIAQQWKKIVASARKQVMNRAALKASARWDRNSWLPPALAALT